MDALGERATGEAEVEQGVTGMAYHDLIGTHTQQDVALDRLYMDVAKYNERIMGPVHVENVANLAHRTSLAYRGVAHLTFPVDIQEMKADTPRSPRNVGHHTSDAWGRSAGLPAEDQLRRTADLLNEGTKVAILAGRGALHAGDELELMVGTSFPYIEFLPKPGQARGVQIELDPLRIGS